MQITPGRTGFSGGNGRTVALEDLDQADFQSLAAGAGVLAQSLKRRGVFVAAKTALNTRQGGRLNAHARGDFDLGETGGLTDSQQGVKCGEFIRQCGVVLQPG